MTVCIAAVACDRRAIVLMADKMLTGGDDLQSESVVKMEPIANDWYALLSGDFSRAREVAFRIRDEVRAKHKGRHVSLGEIKAIAKRHSTALEAEGLEEDVYHPRGLAHDLVTSKRSASLVPLPGWIDGEISEALRNWHQTSGTEIIIAGFGESGRAELFTVTGEKVEHSGARYATVGSGGSAASAYLVQAEDDLSDRLDEWLYWVFEAKATAEYYDGVGYEIDAWIVTQGRAPTDIPGRKVGDPLDLLDDVYKWEHKGPFDPSDALRASPGWKAPKRPPKGWRDTIRAITDPLCAERQSGQRATGARKPGSSQLRKR